MLAKVTLTNCGCTIRRRGGVTKNQNHSVCVNDPHALINYFGEDFSLQVPPTFFFGFLWGMGVGEKYIMFFMRRGVKLISINDVFPNVFAFAHVTFIVSVCVIYFTTS
jgi:hypothetical protein